MKKKKADTKKTLRSHHYIEREKSRKHLSGILMILATLTKKHIIQCNNKPISNIPEEPRDISSMAPIGFRNGPD